jgi:hypothetical protein
MIRGAVPVAILSFTLLLPARAQVCDLVQGGDPTDGITTVTVLSPEAACGDLNLFGFRCMTLRSTANSTGSNYDVQVAWNLPGQTVRGSFLWVSGDGGNIMLRMNPAAKTVQNDLATTSNIRTIETKWLDVDGYHVFPSNGPTNISEVIMDLLEYLIARGTMAGVHGYVGVSGGTQLAADALAYHDGGVLLDGLVLAGGPTFVDLQTECTVPASPLYANSIQRDKVDLYNYTDLGSQPCAANDPAPNPPYACRSTITSFARKSYPDEAVHLVIGTDENDWITSTSSYYFDNVSALARTYEQPAAGAEAAKARILSIVTRYESGAGTVPDGTLTMGKSGGNVTLAWGAACRTAADYEVYEGQLGVPTSLVSRLCSTAGQLSASLTPSAGNRFYLVVPKSAAGNEGSYGKASDGTERAPAAAACAPQLLAGCP